MMLTSNIECNGSLETNIHSHKAMWENQHVGIRMKDGSYFRFGKDILSI